MPPPDRSKMDSPGQEQQALPCPFCGEPPTADWTDDGEKFGVWCMNDECGAQPWSDDRLASRTLAAWNTRASRWPKYEKEDPAAWEAKLEKQHNEITAEAERMSVEDLKAHYVSAMLNWDITLDERDRLNEQLVACSSPDSEAVKGAIEALKMTRAGIIPLARDFDLEDELAAIDAALRALGVK